MNLRYSEGHRKIEVKARARSPQLQEGDQAWVRREATRVQLSPPNRIRYQNHLDLLEPVPKILSWH